MIFFSTAGQVSDIVHDNPSVAQILGGLKFVDSIKSIGHTDLVRIDHVGEGVGAFIPLIVSEAPIKSRYKSEYLLIDVNRRDMVNFEKIITTGDTQVRTQPSSDYGVFRIVYRFGKTEGMYFIRNSSEASRYFDHLLEEVKKLKNTRLTDVIIQYRKGTGA